MFEHQTICLLYLLNLVFAKVTMYKPGSSKGGNSEIYIICLKYKGIEILNGIWNSLLDPFKRGSFPKKTALFSLKEIDTKFLYQLFNGSQFFINKQMNRINDNIQNFQICYNASDNARIHRLKQYVANRFGILCKLKQILPQCRLLPFSDMGSFNNDHGNKFLDFQSGVYKVTVFFNKNCLNPVVGKPIREVKSSSFCSPDVLKLFNSEWNWNKSNGCLFQKVSQKLQKNSLVLYPENRTKSWNTYQNKLFASIMTSEKNHIIAIRIPLVTSFLVGLFYVLCHFYECLYFHRSGFIMLCDRTGNSLIRTKQFLGDIYRRYLEQKPIKSELIQMVRPQLLRCDSFFEFIWNYNRIVISQLIKR